MRMSAVENGCMGVNTACPWFSLDISKYRFVIVLSRNIGHTTLSVLSKMQKATFMAAARRIWNVWQYSGYKKPRQLFYTLYGKSYSSSSVVVNYEQFILRISSSDLSSLRRYIQAVRRLKAEGQKFLRTLHLTFVPGKSFRLPRI